MITQVSLKLQGREKAKTYKTPKIKWATVNILTFSMTGPREVRVTPYPIEVMRSINKEMEFRAAVSKATSSSSPLAA
jgi:hypothetical protein